MPYFADMLQETAEDTYTQAEWKETIGDQQPGGGETLSLESGTATIVATVPWNKRRSFLRFVLGWSYADQGAPYRLRRENPQNHPAFPWLTASNVSFGAIAPLGVDGMGTKVDGVYSAGLPQAAYQKVIATVQFTDQRCFFLADSYATSAAREAERNTFYDPVPSVEIISAEGLNNIAFANGPARGAAIPAPFGTLMSKMTKTYTWLWVPHEYVSGSDPLQFTPTKINNCIGRVNSATFLGHPAGTLLLQAPVFTRFRFPIQTADVFDGFFGWNIRLPLQFFDPPRGGDSGTLTTRTDNDTGVITIPAVGTPAVNHGFALNDVVTVTGGGATRSGMSVTAFTATTITVDGGTGDALPAAGTAMIVYNDAYRGHQLVPRRDDLLWYGAKRQNGLAKLYPEADFAQIFEHVDS